MKPDINMSNCANKFVKTISLDIGIILNFLKDLCETKRGAKEAISLPVYTSKDEIYNKFKEIDEAKEFLEIEETLNFGEVFDLDVIFSKLSIKDIILSTNEIFTILKTIQAGNRIIKKIVSVRERYRTLYVITKGYSSLKKLEDLISSKFTNHGRLSDNASNRLFKIRQEKRAVKEEIKTRLSQLLNSPQFNNLFNERIITTRNDRYVIPIRADQKHMLKGIVHDVSNSGHTLFIEPISILSKNNRLNLLKSKEVEEEEKILYELSQEIYNHIDLLRKNIDILTSIDLIFAKAKLSNIMNANSIEIEDKSGISFINARHPVLLLKAFKKERELPVPIDIKWPEEIPILIISGPNFCGKTVALKTIGLLQIMVQMGLHVPVNEGSKASIFDGIWSEIGDEQDIEAGESTFSARINHIRELFYIPAGNLLVLIDELGTGTDPLEGSALAISILDHLESKGFKVAITTHLDELKSHGLLRENWLLCSVDYDEEMGIPSYKLKYGIAQPSKAITMAEDLGLPSMVIDSAKDYLKSMMSPQKSILYKLSSLEQELKNKYRELEKEKTFYKEKKERLTKAIHKFRKTKDSIIENFASEMKLRLTEMEREWEAIIKAGKEQQNELYRIPSFIKAKKKDIASIYNKKPKKVEINYENIFPGNKVFVEKLKKVGKIIQIKPRKAIAEVRVNGVKTIVPFSQLLPVSNVIKERKKDKGYFRLHVKEDEFKNELNLIGKRVEEALEILDKYIDRALLYGVKEVRIVHGYGTGRLREGIWNHLRESKWISRLSFAPEEEGGRAVTMVTIG